MNVLETAPVKEQLILTKQQMKILRHAAMGLSNLEIGEELKIPSRVVRNHFSARQKYGRYDGIFARLDVYSRREAVLKAIALRYLNPLELTTKEERQKCESLLDRQMEVLSLLSDSSLNPNLVTSVAIAKKLGISSLIVKDRLQSIYKKLELGGLKKSCKSTRAAVIFLAHQREKGLSPHPTLHTLEVW